MKEEAVPAWQMICLMIVFIMGGSVIVGVNTELGQDSWAVVLLSWAAGIVPLLIYSWLMRQYPGLDFYQMMEAAFGKVCGKVLQVLTACYAVFLGASVLRNFAEFVKAIIMPITPRIVTMLVIMSVVMYLAASGTRILGKWAVVIITFIIVIVLLTVLLSLDKMSIDRLLPAFNHSPADFLKNTGKLFACSYGESVLFLTFAPATQKSCNPYKIYLLGTGISAVFIFSVVLKNLLCLGPYLTDYMYFASYGACRIITIGDFLSHIEGTVTVSLFPCVITKLSVCTIAAARGLCRIFSTGKPRNMVCPAGMLILAFGYIIYVNIMDNFTFLPYYAIYAAQFEVLLPLAIWVAAKIRKRPGTERLSAAPHTA